MASSYMGVPKSKAMREGEESRAKRLTYEASRFELGGCQGWRVVAYPASAGWKLHHPQGHWFHANGFWLQDVTFHVPPLPVVLEEGAPWHTSTYEWLEGVVVEAPAHLTPADLTYIQVLGTHKIRGRGDTITERTYAHCHNGHRGLEVPIYDF